MAKKRSSVAAQVFNKAFSREVILNGGKRVILYSDRALSDADATAVVKSMKSLGHLRFGKAAVLEMEVPEDLLRMLGR